MPPTMPPGMPPGMPGMLPGAPGGIPPDTSGMMMMPPADETGQIGLLALDRLLNKPAQGTLRLQRIVQALQMASKLIAAALPDVAETKPNVSKSLHIIGRQIADAILEIQQEASPEPPPEALFAGMGTAGLPGMGLPGPA